MGSCSKEFSLTVNAGPGGPVDWTQLLWQDTLISQSGSATNFFTPVAGLMDDDFTLGISCPSNPANSEVNRDAVLTYNGPGGTAHIHMDITKSVPNPFLCTALVTITQNAALIYSYNILAHANGVWTVDDDFIIADTLGANHVIMVSPTLVLRWAAPSQLISILGGKLT